MSSAHTPSPEALICVLYGEAHTLWHDPSNRTTPVRPSSARNGQLMSILDALAGVCLYERRHQSFAVSMSISQGPTPGVTLYVSQNGTVPQFVVDHLLDIRARLAQIKMLSAKSVGDIEDSGMAQ